MQVEKTLSMHEPLKTSSTFLLLPFDLANQQTVAYLHTQQLKSNTVIHFAFCLSPPFMCMYSPWWLAGPLSQERVVDSAPPEHRPPAGSERGLDGRS